jgi:hypothetical protein
MLTRRDFLAGLAVAAMAAPISIAPAPIALAATNPRAPRPPVVGFHMDQPYLDVTGTAVPYVPPNGLRAGVPVEHLSEAELRTRHLYL